MGSLGKLAVLLIALLALGCATMTTRTLEDYSSNHRIEVDNSETGCFNVYPHPTADRVLLMQCLGAELRHSLLEGFWIGLFGGQPDYGATRWEFVGAAAPPVSTSSASSAAATRGSSRNTRSATATA